MSDSINTNNKQNYDKYVVDNSNPLGNGREEMIYGNKDIMGQARFSCDGKMIYDDETRDTENDMIADKGVSYQTDSQGGMY